MILPYYILPALPRCELHQFQLLGRPVNKCGQRCLALHFCNTRVGSWHDKRLVQKKNNSLIPLWNVNISLKLDNWEGQETEALQPAKNTKLDGGGLQSFWKQKRCQSLQEKAHRGHVLSSRKHLLRSSPRRSLWLGFQQHEEVGNVQTIDRSLKRGFKICFWCTSNNILLQNQIALWRYPTPAPKYAKNKHILPLPSAKTLPHFSPQVQNFWALGRSLWQGGLLNSNGQNADARGSSGVQRLVSVQHVQHESPQVFFENSSLVSSYCPS